MTIWWKAVVRGGVVAMILWAANPAPAQAQPAGSADLLQLVRSLGQTARVLVVSARPEEEPAGLVAWLHHGQGAEVGVVSLHRGESGVNRFGREVGQALGVLRVQEMLEVRRIAGGRQYFTRAYDFGDIGPAEDLSLHWPPALLVGDLVTIFRAFRPHVVILACEQLRGQQDRHRQAAVQMARLALQAAADTAEYPIRQSGFHPPWAAGTLYQVACDGEAGDLTINLGDYDPVLGESYLGIGARAMTLQRSQGLGTAVPLGPAPINLRLLEQASPPDASVVDLPAALAQPLRAVLREGDTPSQQVDSLAALVDTVRTRWSPVQPDAVLPQLLGAIALSKEMLNAIGSAWPPNSVYPERQADRHAYLDLLHGRLSRLALAAAGVETRLESQRAAVAQNDTVQVRLTVANTGRHPVEVQAAHVRLGTSRPLVGSGDTLVVQPGQVVARSATVLPLDISIPYWLGLERPGDWYAYPADVRATPALLEGEAAARFSTGSIRFVIDGIEVDHDLGPVLASRVDLDRGEIREPVVVMPPVTVMLERVLDYVVADAPVRRRMRVELQSWTTRERAVEVRVTLPEGLQTRDPVRQLVLASGERVELLFELEGVVARERHTVEVVAVSEGQRFMIGAIPIDYPHISRMPYFRGSGLWLDAAPVAVAADMEVGYLPGDNDYTHVALRQVQINATELTPASLDSTGLARYARLALGPRVLRNPEVYRAVPDLLDWVRRGGRLVVQYGGEELIETGLLPWPVYFGDIPLRIEGGRVTFRPAEGAESWWQRPHPLDDKDLDGWVRPIAPIMPDSLDARYQPLVLLGDADGNEMPVVWAATLGRGMVIYSALNLPRQVVAGEAGALRLLLNLLLGRAR
jgi:LmbE family N-acetylglucosaminyl deacetylase